jgi:CBS domain-containing protein
MLRQKHSPTADLKADVTHGQNSSLPAAIVSPEGEFQKARDVMKVGAKTIGKDSSVYEAISILVERHITGLPVVDGADLVGIITEKDILRLVWSLSQLSGTLAEYMTRQVVTFNEEDNLAEIWACLMENDFRRVPILRDGTLTGVISRADLIHAHLERLRTTPSEQSSTPAFEGPRAREVMTSGLLTTRPDTPIYEAVRTIADNDITGLPVVEDSMHLVGLISEKDVLKAVCDPQAQSWRVRDVMTREVVSFTPEDSLSSVCECLAKSHFRRVPVLERGRLVGIVSRADLILFLLKHPRDMLRPLPV